MTADDLRSAFQRDDRQMLPAIMKVRVERELVAWLFSDERERRGAGRASRPAFTRLDPRSSIGRPQS